MAVAKPVPDPSLLLHFDNSIYNSGLAGGFDTGTTVWSFDTVNEKSGVACGYSPTVPHNIFAPAQQDGLTYFANSFTIEGYWWFNLANGANLGMMGAYAGDGFFQNWMLQRTTTQFKFLWNSGPGPGVGVDTVIAGSVALVSSVWHHYAVDYDGSRLSLYVDGAVLTTASVGHIQMRTSARTFALGNVQSTALTTAAFAGLIDEVRVVPGAALYQNAGFTPPTSNLPDGFTDVVANGSPVAFKPSFYQAAANSVSVVSAGIYGVAVASGDSIVYTPTSGFYGVDTIGYLGVNASGNGPVGSHVFRVNAASPLPTPVRGTSLLVHMKNGDLSDATGVHTMDNPNGSLTAAASGTFFANTITGFNFDANYILRTTPGAGASTFPGSYTVEVKFRSNNAGPMPRTDFISPASNFNYSLTGSGSNFIWTLAASGGNISTLVGSYAVSSSSWYDLAVDFDGEWHRMFINGAMIAKTNSFTSNNKVMATTAATVGIGGDINATFSTYRGFMGEMAELRFNNGNALYDDAGYSPVDYHYNDKTFLTPYNGFRWVKPDFTQQALATTVTGSSAHGTVTGSQDWLKFTPNSGFFGVATVAYQGNNANGGGLLGFFAFDVEAPVVPTASNVEQIVLADTPTWISLHFDMAVNSVQVGTGATHGTAVASGTGILYTPTGGYLGDDSFTYAGWVDDISNFATATIHVNTVLPATGDKQRLFPGQGGYRMFPSNAGRDFPHT